MHFREYDIYYIRMLNPNEHKDADRFRQLYPKIVKTGE